MLVPFVVGLALWAPPVTEAAPTKFETVELHTVERKIIERTNAERSRHGLSPLKVDEKLIKSARAHTAWMVHRRMLRHTSQSVAENIAMGQRNTHEVLRSWMGSPGHRANILNRSYRRIGVAAYVARDGTIYWCQQFLQ